MVVFDDFLEAIGAPEPPPGAHGVARANSGVLDVMTKLCVLKTEDDDLALLDLLSHLALFAFGRQHFAAFRPKPRRNGRK